MKLLKKESVRLHKKNGFTLLELILAIGLFSIGIMAAIASFPALKHFYNVSWEFKKAQVLASDKMEELLASREYIVSGEENKNELISCKRVWKVVKADKTTSLLTVSVIWTGKEQRKDKQTKEVSIETLVLQ